MGRRSFRAADYDIGNYLMMAEFKERMAVSKQRTTHRVYMERFNLKKLIEVEGKERYRVGSQLLENLEADVNRAWKLLEGI
jgi:hypothetical protein